MASRPPRRRRAKIGALVTATAIVIWGSPRSSQATMPMASRMPGMASRTSTTRIRTLSARPPAAPAMAPTKPPMITPKMTEPSPTRRLIRAPYTTRVNSSRPCRSWPMRCSGRGGYGPVAPPLASGGGGDRAPGAGGGGGGAGGTTATVPLGISGVPDARVEEGVGDVHDKVHHQEDEGEDEDRRLHHEVVAVTDGVDDPAPHAVPGEDGLGDDRAGEQAADLEADDRHHRQPGVAHDVPSVDTPLGEALGARRAHVVLVGDLDDRGTRDARDDGQRDGAQGDRRQDQVADAVDERIDLLVERPARVQPGVEEHEVRLQVELQTSVDTAPPRWGFFMHPHN